MLKELLLRFKYRKGKCVNITEHILDDGESLKILKGYRAPDIPMQWCQIEGSAWDNSIHDGEPISGTLAELEDYVVERKAAWAESDSEPEE